MNPDSSNSRVLRRPRTSLRFKLTAWMVAIACVIQLSLAMVLQLYQARAIEDFFDTRMSNRVRTVAQRLVASLPDVSRYELDAAVHTQGETLAGTALSYQLVDAAGHLIASSGPPGADISPDLIERALKNPNNPRVTVPAAALGPAAPRGEFLRAAVAPIAARDGARYYLLMMYDDLTALRMLWLLQRVVLFSVPIGVVASAVSAWVIAGLAVKPFESIRAAARRLAPESISTRIEVPSATSSEVLSVREELESTRRRFEQAFAAQERFMSNVSHELKTPIAVILTEAQMLKTEHLPRQINEFLKSQREELERLGTMVDSFLLLTRMRGGMKEPPHAQACYIRDVLFESYASCLPLAKQHRVRIDLRLPAGDDADARVTGNADLLRVVFDNIVRNGIRFSPQNAVLSVQAGATLEKILVTIRDHGAGIPPDLLPRIFDRFSQASDEQRRGRGHGLGLEIALGIAELHSGTISVSNCVDGGCEFVVTLPRRSDDPDAAHTSLRAFEPHHGSRKSGEAETQSL